MRNKQAIKRSAAARLTEILMVLFIAVLSLLPILWGVITSLKTQREIAAFPPKLWGFALSLEHYRTIFSGGFLRSIANSIAYSGSAIVLGLVVGYLAAYGFQRARFPLKKLFFYIVVAGIPLSVGSSVFLVPNYLYMSSFGMTNRWYTLILLYTAYNLPMAIWLILGGIKAVPIEIEEAAVVDGCSRWFIVTRIIPPLIKPSLGASSIFIFIGAWNEYITASVMIDTPALKTIQMSIYDYLGYFGQEWGPLTASATIAVIPILLVFTFLGRTLVSGLTAGAVKG